MDNLLIRKATENDYEIVMQLYGLFVENKQRYVNLDNDSYNTVINDPNSSIELGIIDDKIISFIMYSIRNVVRYLKPIVEVEEFFVLEEFRRLKIGKKLMDKVFDFAKNKNCQYIFLASGKERIPAHKFYKNDGFDEYAFHYRKKI
jgi:GNAT superfamily N-acetyltransferase